MAYEENMLQTQSLSDCESSEFTKIEWAILIAIESISAELGKQWIPKPVAIYIVSILTSVIEPERLLISLCRRGYLRQSFGSTHYARSNKSRPNVEGNWSGHPPHVLLSGFFTRLAMYLRHTDSLADLDDFDKQEKLKKERVEKKSPTALTLKQIEERLYLIQKPKRKKQTPIALASVLADHLLFEKIVDGPLMSGQCLALLRHHYPNHISVQNRQQVIRKMLCLICEPMTGGRKKIDFTWRVSDPVRVILERRKTAPTFSQKKAKHFLASIG